MGTGALRMLQCGRQSLEKVIRGPWPCAAAQRVCLFQSPLPADTQGSLCKHLCSHHYILFGHLSPNSNLFFQSLSPGLTAAEVSWIPKQALVCLFRACPHMCLCFSHLSSSVFLYQSPCNQNIDKNSVCTSLLEGLRSRY